ncbi:MAG: NADH-quinone oxidoreductase subunit C [Bacteroidota bacterium]
MQIKELTIEKIRNAMPGAVLEVSDFRDELTLTVGYDTVTGICRLIRDDSELQFGFCEDVTAIDWARRKNRFTMVYHLYSMKNNFRLRLKADLPAEETESITSVYPGANWYERETYDMFGIRFNGHPDLRRVYMPEEFEYHPLRKEFPLLGIPGSLNLPQK